MCVRMSMIYILHHIYIDIDIYIYSVCVCVFLFIYIDQVTFTFISVINDMYIHVYTRACVCARASMFLYHIYLCISICTSG